MRRLLLLSLLVVQADLYSQTNLVADSSFELYSYFPASRLSSPDSFNSILHHWLSPTDGTPDYCHMDNPYLEVSLPFFTWSFRDSGKLHLCTNFQAPHTGRGCVAFACGVDLITVPSTRINEYIQTRLIEPMKNNHVYSVSFYTNRSYCSNMAFTNIGAYISRDSIRQFYPNNGSYPNYTNFEKPYQPQVVNRGSTISDTNSWIKITGLYKARGGERWLTLGHFNLNNENLEYINDITDYDKYAYYFIDDVSAYEQKGAIYPDTFCKGDTVKVTSNRSGPHAWYCNNTLLSTDSVYHFVPVRTQTYVLETPGINDTFVMYMDDRAVFTLGNDTVMCSGDTIQKRIAKSNCTILWDNQSTVPLRLIQKEGLYTASVEKNGCTYKDSILIGEKPKPPLEGASRKDVCRQDRAFIHVELDNQYTYYWHDFKDSLPARDLSQPGMYKVSVRHKNGCIISGLITLGELCSPELWMPTAFAPQGINNTFGPKGYNIRDYTLTIFNLWGEQLFETSAPGTWDGAHKGTVCPQGIYMYILTYTDFNHRTYFTKGILELLH